MKTKVNCAGCKQPVEVTAPESPSIVNTEKTSVIVVDHPFTGYCETCRKPVSLQVAGVNLMVCAVPIEAPSPLVIPGRTAPQIDASKLKV